MDGWHEKEYGLPGEVRVSFVDPDMITHRKQNECELECPHNISECPLWKPLPPIEQPQKNEQNSKRQDCF